MITGGVKVAIHLHPLPRLRMSGATLLLLPYGVLPRIGEAFYFYPYDWLCDYSGNLSLLLVVIRSLET